jgi:hypothetical protein
MNILPLLLILLVWCSPTVAADLFEGTEPIEVQLTGPVKSVTNDTVHREEQPFQLIVDGIEIPVKARVRGKSRARVCKFPPLRLNFTGSETRQTVFEGLENLKLVTHCRDDKGYDRNVLEEYVVYRIFNLLSEYSYRVRLLHIRYRDIEQDPALEAKPQYGFVIEPKPQLQARTTGKWVQLPGVKLSRVEENQAALVFVFQYLIGNTDWSLVLADGDDACCHNGDLLEVGSELYLVPYDFDLSGLVNATYAKPDPSLRLKNVRQRRYRGYCINPAALRSALHIVKSKQADILGVLKELPEYPDKAASNSTRYLGRFFELADNETSMIDTFERWCLG